MPVLRKRKGAIAPNPAAASWLHKSSMCGVTLQIAPNILTDRLRRLEREGVLISRTYQERPPRRDYALSEDGRELAGVLRLLAAWASAGSQAAAVNEGMRHVDCGTVLEARWYCPTCARAIDEEDASDLSYA